MWYQVKNNNLFFKVHVQPKAKKNAVIGTHGDALKIAIKAPPLEGKANKALVEFLAKLLGKKRNEISIESGMKSRDKIICIRDLDPDTFKTTVGCETFLLISSHH